MSEKKTPPKTPPKTPAKPSKAATPVEAPVEAPVEGVVKVKHKKTGNEFEVSASFFEANKSILERL